jgi:hypothetical protein
MTEARDGRYAFRGLPAGRYLAIAVPVSVSFDPYDLDRLAAIATRATPLELGDHDVKTVDLKVDVLP